METSYSLWPLRSQFPGTLRSFSLSKEEATHNTTRWPKWDGEKPPGLCAAVLGAGAGDLTLTGGLSAPLQGSLLSATLMRLGQGKDTSHPSVRCTE